MHFVHVPNTKHILLYCKIPSKAVYTLAEAESLKLPFASRALKSNET